MEIKSQVICPSCRSAILPADYFCPNCGRQLKNKAPSATFAKQFVVYFVSLFLPPFGLWYAWKYLRADDSKSKKIGAAAIILTIISVLITIWMAQGFIISLYQSLNAINQI